MKHLQKLGYTTLGAVLALTVVSAVPAIAAQIQTITVTLNSVNIEVNGQKVAVSGENYTLDNGKQTAGSIVYNETTYVPIRKFGEIMGAEIGYDGATGSVTVKGDVKGAEEPTTPNTITPPSDYANWTAEEETAYQEFKAMWKVSNTNSLGVQTKLSTVRYATTNLSSENTKQSLISFGEGNVKMFVKRMTEEQYKAVLPSRDELSKYENMFVLWFWTGEVQFSGLCEVNADYIKATETYSELSLPSKK